MKKLVLVSIYLIYLTQLSFSQNKEWINYPYGKTVNCMAHEGNTLWVGTSGGLVRINMISGYRIFYSMNNSQLPDNSINTIAIDSSGYKWIGTNRGLVKYKDNEWYLFNMNNSALTSNVIYSLAVEDKNIIWIGTNAGLLKFDGTNWKIFNTDNTAYGLPSNIVSSICIEKNGIKWIGSQGLARLDEKVWWNVFNDQNSMIPSNRISCIYIDKRGIKWIGTTYGLAKFDETNWTIFKFSTSEGNGHIVRSISMDSEDNLWLGTDNGLIKFDGQNNVRYNTSNSGLPNNDITSLLITSEDKIWVGTKNQLAKFENNNWTLFNTAEYPLTSKWIYGIAFDSKNNAFIAVYDPEGTHQHSFVKLDRNNWTVHEFPDRKFGSVTCMLVDKLDNIYVGTYRGLIKYSGNEWQKFGDSYSLFMDKNIKSLTLDCDNNLWLGFGYPDGIAKLSNSGIIDSNPLKTGTILSVSAVGFDNLANLWFESPPQNLLMKYDGKDMMSFFRPNSSYNESRGFGIDNNNNIWCATYSGGLAKFNGSDFSIYNMSNSKIPSNYLQTLVVDEIGNVWIGSQFSGLVKFDGKNWTIYTSGNSGLQDNSIRSLAFDKFKNLWIGTQSGISVFKEGGVITSIHEYIETNIPKTFFLSQNYPNPFNPTTTIQYSIPTEGYVTLKVYDMIGREVKILVDEEKSPGKYEAIFNRASLPSGVYFYKLTACTFNQTKKMILLK